MRETGIHDLTPYIESATKTSPSDPPSDPLSLRERARVRAPLSPHSAGDDPVHPPLSPRAAGGDAESRGGSPAFPTPTPTPAPPTTPVQRQPKPDHQPTKPAQDRTNSPTIPRSTRQIALRHPKNPPSSPNTATADPTTLARVRSPRRRHPRSTLQPREPPPVQPPRRSRNTTLRLMLTDPRPPTG